jgi:preprotein translocase subunit SecB
LKKIDLLGYLVAQLRIYFMKAQWNVQIKINISVATTNILKDKYDLKMLVQFKYSEVIIHYIREYHSSH